MTYNCLFLMRSAANVVNVLAHLLEVFFCGHIWLYYLSFMLLLYVNKCHYYLHFVTYFPLIFLQ